MEDDAAGQAEANREHHTILDQKADELLETWRLAHTVDLLCMVCGTGWRRL